MHDAILADVGFIPFAESSLSRIFAVVIKSMNSTIS